jgi:L-ascorbate metabolism protein UlaG (beta-lactamase superfamily)
MVTTVTRITHSCALLDCQGQVILTDPWFSEKPGYYRGEPLAFTPNHLAEAVGGRRQPRPLRPRRLRRLPRQDRALHRQTRHGDKARRAGFTEVTEVEPWEEVNVGDLKVTAAPARHGVPEITFILQGAGKTIFFGADTLRIPKLDEVPRRFSDIALALLPINGLLIRPFNRQVVMNAEQAGQYATVSSSNTMAHRSASSAPSPATHPRPA